MSNPNQTGISNHLIKLSTVVAGVDGKTYLQNQNCFNVSNLLPEMRQPKKRKERKNGTPFKNDTEICNNLNAMDMSLLCKYYEKDQQKRNRFCYTHFSTLAFIYK